jgi:hypothetical protein
VKSSGVVGHPWYNGDYVHHVVTVDGLRIDHCTAASEEDGEAHFYVEDTETGRLVVDAEKGEYKEEVVRGVVKVIDKRLLGRSG